MSEDLDLQERFEPLAAATFVPRTAPGVLQATLVRRRHRRRAMIVGAVAVCSLVVGGVLLALAAPGRSAPDSEVRSGPSPATTIPASYGTEPRLVIGSIPAELSSQGCAKQFLDRWVVTCALGIPSTVVPDGINLVWRAPPLDRGVREAWDRGEAPAVAAALDGTGGTPAFVHLGGRTVLDLGETDRLSGSDLGRPSRITRTLEVRLGPSIVQVNAEGVTDEQLDQVVRGLGWQPVDLGFAIPEGILPATARAMAEGQKRLWFEPDLLDPSRSADNGGQASGITYELQGARSPLEVVVVRLVDADAYVASWSTQQERLRVAATRPISPYGRSGTMVDLRSGGAPSGPISARRLAVAIDDRTVVIVSGPAKERDTMLAIAGQVSVRPGSGSATSGGDAVGPTTAPHPVATGWYVPRGLPDGWSATRSVAQAVDGVGEAQLWFVSPTGNQLVVTLKVPLGRGWPPDAAVLHPLPGLVTPVYALGGKQGFARATLLGARPAATIDVTLLDGGRADANSPEAVAAGLDELDLLMGSLQPVGAEAWRAFIEPTAPPASLVEAGTLEDLPDST